MGVSGGGFVEDWKEDGNRMGATGVKGFVGLGSRVRYFFIVEQSSSQNGPRASLLHRGPRNIARLKNNESFTLVERVYPSRG
jgi:hypothetical protein